MALKRNVDKRKAPMIEGESSRPRTRSRRMRVMIREPDEGSQTTQQGTTNGVHGQGPVDGDMRQVEPVVPASRAGQDIPVVTEEEPVEPEASDVRAAP
ncbi:hypothetical protein ACLOJK_041420 [Asimina triloba]